MSMEDDVRKSQHILAKYNEKLRQIKKRQQDVKAQVQAKKRAIQKPEPKFYAHDKPPVASTIYPHNNGGMGMKFRNPMQRYLSKQEQDLQNRIAQIRQEYQKEARLLKNAESLHKGGSVPSEGGKTLEHNLKNQLSPKFVPGNVGDINRVIWPFWFTSSKVTLEPNTTAQGNITVTQEAAFIWVSYQITVMLEDVGNPNNYEYIDPDQPGASGKFNDLTFLFIDSRSQRQYSNRPVDANQAGHWKFPTILPTPQLILPNANLEWNFTNNNANNTYRPFISMFGYRVRVEHAKDILELLKA